VKRVCIRRHPSVYLLGLAELLVVHFVLCYPAATCRGWPPLETFWQVAIYIGFLGIALLPAFDDFGYAPGVRRILIAGFSVASSIILGAARVNFGGPTPHFGHSARYPGLLRYLWPEILLESLFCSVIAVTFVFCWESVSRGIWDKVRRFDSARPSALRVVDFLLIVVSVGVLCGILRFLFWFDPYYFTRPFFKQ
jgi:hypothetical protein